MAEFIAGRHSVLEALKSGRSINRIFILRGMKEGAVREVIGLARERGIPFQEAERNYLDGLTKEQHQGMVAEV